MCMGEMNFTALGKKLSFSLVVHVFMFLYCFLKGVITITGWVGSAATHLTLFWTQPVCCSHHPGQVLFCPFRARSEPIPTPDPAAQLVLILLRVELTRCSCRTRGCCCSSSRERSTVSLLLGLSKCARDTVPSRSVSSLNTPVL